MARNFSWPPLGDASPIQFNLDGTTTGVFEDTVTPGNSTPLPVKVLSIDPSAGLATEATLQAVDANLTAANVTLTSLDGKDYATETTLATRASEATLALLEAKDFATEVTAAASLTRLIQILTRVSGKTVVQTVRLSYTGTPVDTTNWTEIVASLPAIVNGVSVFDSSGQSLEIGVGAAAAEVRRFLVYPGGNANEPIAFAINERVSIRALSADATEGELLINFYS